MAFGVLQNKPLSSHQQSNNYLLGLLNNNYIPASTNLVEYKKETGSSVVNRSATFHFPLAAKMIAAL